MGIKDELQKLSDESKERWAKADFEEKVVTIAGVMLGAIVAGLLLLLFFVIFWAIFGGLVKWAVVVYVAWTVAGYFKKDLITPNDLIAKFLIKIVNRKK